MNENLYCKPSPMSLYKSNAEDVAKSISNRESLYVKMNK